jgi:hypothetical protein
MWVLAATLSCGLTTVFTSCSEDDVKDIFESVNIIGTWKGSATLTPTPSTAIEIYFDGTTTFDTDHTFTNTDDDGTKTKGTWSLDKQVLTMKQNIDGITVTQTYHIDDNWSRDKMVMTTTFDDTDINGKIVHYTITITLRRVD